MEVLGCGVTQRQILEEAGHMGKTAWAFGWVPLLFLCPSVSFIKGIHQQTRHHSANKSCIIEAANVFNFTFSA